jgi:hypothetical protein
MDQMTSPRTRQSQCLSGLAATTIQQEEVPRIPREFQFAQALDLHPELTFTYNKTIMAAAW